MSRGRAQHSKDIIEASYEILEEIEPATVRAVCYKPFVRRLIKSMAKSETNKISRLLRLPREDGEIPWEWIVDETREAERVSAWDNPRAYAKAVVRSYRRDYWSQQPIVVEVWSEKGTVRGTLAPVLKEYGVTFRVMHGYGSATDLHQIAKETENEPVLVLYVGDWDPSGLCMSEHDLPGRLKKYDGGHVVLKRISLTQGQLAGLPGFPAKDKSKDKRYKWYIKNYGALQGVSDENVECWELDALDPNILRDCVRQAIEEEIEWAAWERCKVTERAEQVSLKTVMAGWKMGGPANLPMNECNG